MLFQWLMKCDPLWNLGHMLFTQGWVFESVLYSKIWVFYILVEDCWQKNNFCALKSHPWVENSKEPSALKIPKREEEKVYNERKSVLVFSLGSRSHAFKHGQNEIGWTIRRITCLEILFSKNVFEVSFSNLLNQRSYESWSTSDKISQIFLSLFFLRDTFPFAIHPYPN